MLERLSGIASPDNPLLRKTHHFGGHRVYRLYLSVGDLSHNDRASLILVGALYFRRLNIRGHTKTVDLATNPPVTERLRDPDYGARIVRGLVIGIEGFDWNCPQHITPR